MSDGTNGATNGHGETEQAVIEALKAVVDPELGINIVDLGLVYDVAVEDEVAKVTYTLTSMGCPVGPLIEQQMSAMVTQIPGISQVEATMTFEPPWTPERMTDDARMALGMF